MSVKISELPLLSTISSDDYIPITDTGPLVTKRIAHGNLMASVATDSTVQRLHADRFGEVINVKDYDSIQDAFNAAVSRVTATIVFPYQVGGYSYSTPLVLVPTSGQIHINLMGLGGAGANGVVLRYTGIGGTALTIKNNTRFQVSNLHLLNAGTGTTGLFVSSLASGSSTGPAVFTNVAISGFTKNYVIGQVSGEAASEFAYINLEVSNGASHGIEINASNSLNHVFYHLNMVSNGTGLEAVDPDDIYIYGGSASGQTVEDFAFRQAGAFSISGYRSETANRFLTIGPSSPAGAGSPTNIVVENCRIANTLNADNRAIRVHKSIQGRILANHILDGHISISLGSTVSSHLAIMDNLVVDGTYLYEFEDSNTSTLQLEARGNRSSTSSGSNYWPDEHFVHTLGTNNFLSFIDLTTPTAPITKRSHTVVATGSLPAAGAAMNGTILIEDVGAGDRNLIVYAGGQRFRIDGGAAF